MNFALIGCGHIAQRHAQLIPQYGNLVAVCDIDADKAQALATKYAASAYTALSDLLAAEHSIDMVVICTPNGLHASQTIACLQAGKHVICEKPMALKASDCDAMIQAAQSILVQQKYVTMPLMKTAAVVSMKIAPLVMYQLHLLLTLFL